MKVNMSDKSVSKKIVESSFSKSVMCETQEWPPKKVGKIEIYDMSSQGAVEVPITQIKEAT